MAEGNRKLRRILLDVGLTKELIDRLERKAIDVEDIRYMNERELALELGVERKLARKILFAVEGALIEIRPAYEAIRKRKLLSFGVIEVDQLLGGGLEQGTITELYGKPASGKTQIAIQLSVNVQLEEERGGLSSKALYVDTERGFSPERVVQMAKAKGLKPDSALENILCANAPNTRSLAVTLEKGVDACRRNEIGLLVVDSLISPFRLEYQGIENLARRQQAIMGVLRSLRRIADMGPAVLITNHVLGRVKAGPELEDYLPAGGYALGHAPELVLMVKRLKGNRRLLKIVDSSYLEEGEAPFAMVEAGLIPA